MHTSSDTVVDFYEFVEKVFPESGFRDMTEGIYHGNPNIPFTQAQRNQIDYLLDQVDCKEGSRILDIGCGHGTLLEQAVERGAIATGVTISPAQVIYGQARGLDVRLLNYRNIGEDWNSQFDGIIANGSMEHFVQPEDVAAGRADELYREFFEICHRILNKNSSSRHVATTVIHFGRYHPAVETLRSNPFRHKLGSDDFHVAYLEKVMGGSYPVAGQLARCAQGFFKLVKEVDGTEDYRLTSEAWLKGIRSSFLNPIKAARMLGRLVPELVRSPRHCLETLGLMFTESWQWQFRGKNPPMKLLRQTWETV